MLPSWKTTLLLVLAGGIVGGGGLLAAVAATSIPTPNQVATAQATVIYFADGTREIGRLGEANRTNIRLNSLPAHVSRAVLAAEDRAFYSHTGFSPVGIARAMWANLTSDSLQGASTITQQYAKNAYLTQDRTWQRKVRELVLAIRLEVESDKDQILENYLNTVYFGRGTYGIQTASLAYFGRDAADLTVEQAAVLAAILRSPGAFSPDVDLERLTGRWGYVLDAMAQEGWISAAQREQAEFPRIRPRSENQRFEGPNGHVLDTIRRELLAVGFTDEEIDRGGLTVITTFDRQAQRALLRAVRDEGPTTGTEGLRIGVAAIRPGTGEVVAMYGGANFLDNQLNNATMAIGQAGSTFKPFTLAAALEQGITLDSLWNGNTGVNVAGYRVNNYGSRSWGRVTLLQAMEQSINTPFVQITRRIGPDAVIDMARRAGLPDDTPALDPVLSASLGVSSPHVIDLAASYATFAAGGRYAAPFFIQQVRGPNGGVLYEHRPEPRSVMDSVIADTVSYALTRAVDVGTGATARALGRPAAGKTGTTNDNMSALFAGYTPDLAAAVMLTKDGADGMPISLSGTGGLGTVTGGSFPARIWTAFMRGALDGQPVRAFPPVPVVVPTTVATPAPTTTGVDTATVAPVDGGTLDEPTAEPTPTTAD